ncbi:MAG TPA: hypothetical protein VIZ18_02035 [Ktedonobacteraceae bacterium]
MGTMNEKTFCSFPLREVRLLGLRAELQSVGDVQRLVLFDKAGVKWEIRPITFIEGEQGREPLTLSLYHRGHNRSMHYQKQSAPAHIEGVRKLLRYIRNHEQYERTGISGRLRKKR